MNPLVQGHSGTTPETSRNAYGTNQGTSKDDSQSDPHPDAGLLRSQTTRNSGPDSWPQHLHCSTIIKDDKWNSRPILRVNMAEFEKLDCIQYLLNYKNGIVSLSWDRCVSDEKSLPFHELIKICTQLSYVSWIFEYCLKWNKISVFSGKCMTMIFSNDKRQKFLMINKNFTDSSAPALRFSYLSQFISAVN